MSVEDFRKDHAKLTREDIPHRIDVYVLELNFLARLARTHGMTVSYDSAERETYTELIVHVTDDRS